MQMLPLFADEYLFSRWEDDFQTYVESRDGDVRQALIEWSRRDKSLSETQLEGQFVEKVFHKLWDYWATGTDGSIEGYTLQPQYPVPGAGQTGGTGKADLALAHFKNDSASDIAQVLCEFKDIRSGLDAPQKRKGNDRSPVQQCHDYLKHAFDKAPLDAAVSPTWGIVTDMNEFRLYHRRSGNARFQRFVIESKDSTVSLVADSPTAVRQRFLFCRLFSRELLLGLSGRSQLDLLLQQQWTHEKTLEKLFYTEYQAYRQHVYEAILEANPGYQGTRGDLVRMTQRFLDRCIFLLFCEDMGKALSFPTDLLRDILKEQSLLPTFAAGFETIWSLVKQLFHTMRDGGFFPPDHQIHRFNGGLFEGLEELEQLKIPNRVFCAKGQGESEEKLGEFRNTLLYLAATYNFGTSGETGERTISLYALGRIFEQSITDLEYMHAEADGVPTVAKLTKRKRDGVYYTPEWVTGYIVQEVVGSRLEDERGRLGLELGTEFDSDSLTKFRGKRRTAKDNPALLHIQKLDLYEEFLDRITILDPACGSGAFLIQALQFLLQHRQDIAAERERITAHPSLFDQDSVIRSILGNNLFGVDINPESVEITQLALWLNTAAPGKPLSTLDEHIRCGNSLVGEDFAKFYQTRHSSLFDEADPAEREKVNAFDWASNFSTVLSGDRAESGFDCIIGNPPYVKLQHFRKVVPDVAEYLVQAKATSRDQAVSDRKLYESTQIKNFDLYLPFFERGISLLHPNGRLGFIAPSVWLLSDYGEGLKKRLLETRRLSRWIDFKDFPVFEEAMTYTALQFFSGSPVSSIRFAAASDGQLATVEDEGLIEYDSLDAKDAWVFLPDRERKLIDRLNCEFTSLDGLPFVKNIFVGVQTSADYIFHHERLGPGRYRHSPASGEPEEIALEDGIMRPLLSGTEAKRYQSPKTDTYVLFPYDDSGEGKPTLLSPEQLSARFPNAWKHLHRYEASLRKRESSAFDDDQWYRFGRNQNIDKQKLRKLGVAQTVPEMRVFYDSGGSFCLNNVRVNGILVEDSHAWFVLGILNSRVADFVFRRISKPKEPRPSGAYFEANKQYIAPLPVPTVNDEQRERVSELAKRLQELHSSRRDTIQEISSRIHSSQMRPDEKKYDWLWADVRTPAAWKKENSADLKGRELTSWAKQQYEQRLNDHIAAIDERISFGQTMLATVEKGELKFYVGNRCIIDGVYVNDDEAGIILPQWQEKARDKFVSESVNGTRIVKMLLDLRTTENQSLIQQLAALTMKLHEVEEQILTNEREMENLVFSLYALTTDERTIVEAGTEQRVKARIPRQQH